MKKRKKDSWVGTTVIAMIADAVAQNAPKGSLAQKHAGQIALRYALKSRAIDRADRLKKFLLFSGLIALVVFVISTWLH